MKGWLRFVRRMRGLALAGWIVALGAAISRGQVLPGEAPKGSEPPLLDAPTPRSPPASPRAPFTPPAPKPLPPENAVPFVPAAPSPLGEALEPIVRLHVRAPSRIEPGKEIEYRITVENVSRAEAHHVVVRDRLPRDVKEAIRAEPKETEKKETKDGFWDLLWDLGTLRPGASTTIVLAIKPPGSEDVQNRAYVQFEQGQQVTTRIAKPSVRVKVTAPSQAILYQPIPIRIEVVNTGTVPVRNAVVTEELPEGLEFVEAKPSPNVEKPFTWKLGDLLPNQSRRIEYQAISKKSGTFRNQVKATAEGGASATGSAAVSVGEAKVEIRVSGPQRRLAKRPIPYHITVRNVGSVPLTNVQVSDELPGKGVEFVSASANGRKEGGFARWSLGTLQPSEQRALLLVLRAPQSGMLWNQAEVRADTNLSQKARDVTTIDPAIAAAIEIDKETDSLVVGQKMTYTIRLYNPGKKGIPNPSVIITVPDEMIVRYVRGATTEQRDGQRVQFDPLKVLAGGKEELYFVEVEAKKEGVANLRAWWTDGRQASEPPEMWEDKTIILGNKHPAVAKPTIAGAAESKSF